LNFQIQDEKSSSSLLNDEDIEEMRESLGIHAVPPEFQDEFNEIIINNTIKAQSNTIKS